MEKLQFELLENDTQIRSVGYLYRNLNKARWDVRLVLEPNQKKDSLTVSNGPLLVRKGYLNPTQIYKPAGYQMSTRISDTSGWQSMRIGDCDVLKDVPVLASDKQQYCFYFTAESGTKFIIPQFELARVLFFRDGYLARTSLEPNSLQTEFSVGSNASGEVQINVQPFSKYPVNSFRDVEKRQNLAWILLDDDVRRSYESIGLHQLKYGEDKTKYRKFDFSFKPPLLSGAHMTVRGRYLKDLDCMFAFEIVSIQNLLYKTPAKVVFFHPRVKEYVRGSGTKGTYPNYSGQDEQSITTDEANADMTRQLMSVQTASIGFLNNVETNIIYKNQKVGSAGRQDENVSERPLRAGSVEDSTLNGNVSPLDWNDLADDVLEDNKYRNRFDSFFQMIKILQRDYGCKILSEETKKLPSIKRCKKHLMENGVDPRCYAVVELEVKGLRFHVVEVDTSDGLHSLSTLLLMNNSHEEWLQNVTLFERELLRGSINWPNKYLKTLCGEKGYKRIPHPRSNDNDLGGLRIDSIRRWAERFYSWIGKP